MREPPLANVVLAPLLVLLAACSGTADSTPDDHASTGGTSATSTTGGDPESDTTSGPAADGGAATNEAGTTGSGDAASGDDGGSSGGKGTDAATDSGALPGFASFLGGTNLSGLEFNDSVVPGKAYTNYGVPTHAEVDYFVGKKLGFIRLPFRWERLQPKLDGALDPTYLGFITDLTDYATSKGATVLLDVHNYARYNGAVIGSTDSGAPTAAQFGDLWSKLATLFAKNPKVVFGLMNEPNSMATELWLSDANAAIAAIRKTGATNMLTVPGNGWTGAHDWSSNSSYGTANSTVMLGVVDPLDNYVFEVHQYLDAYSSGTSSTCEAAPAGAQSLASFTAWAKTNHKRAMIGEFGSASNATCLTDLDGFLGAVDDSRDVWVGWTYWSAGPWWGSYAYSIEPSNGVDAVQTATLLKHL